MNRPRPRVRSSWPMVSAWLLVLAIVVFYAVLCSVAAVLLSLPWWWGPVPMLVTVLAAEACVLALQEEPEEIRDSALLEPDDAPRLHAVVDRLCALTGQDKPELWLIDHPMPNSLAYAPPDGRHAVYVTIELLELLDNRHLEAVMAHELAHLVHHDQKVLVFAKAITGWMRYLPSGLLKLGMRCDWHLCVLARKCGRQWPPSGEPHLRDELDTLHPEPTVPVLLRLPVMAVVGTARTLLAIVILAAFIALAASFVLGLVTLVPGVAATAMLTRRREAAADRAAAELTQAPTVLASALVSMGDRASAIPAQDLRASSGASALAILPFRGEADSRMARAWSTHPPLQRRIAHLQELPRHHPRPPEP